MLNDINFQMKKREMDRTIRYREIQWIQVHFTDLLGRLRVSYFPSKEFMEDVLNTGFNFDGSSIGFVDVGKSDLIAIPDKNTFLPLPHEKNEARIIANIFDNFLKPFLACPRYILKKAIKKMRRQGFDKIKISPEMEFYVIEKMQQKYSIHRGSAYFLPSSLDEAKTYRKELADALRKSGYPIKYHHHEVGRNQHEVEIKALDAMEASDFYMYFKYLAKEIAKSHNLTITFMPKPFQDDAGNGAHMHIVLYKKDKNIFYNENDEYNLSQTARYFIGGILEHAPAITAIANPTINSYKRLIAGFEAPCYISWGRYNRSSLIRIPAKKDIDIEIRIADPAANPYLLYAAVLHAGIDGIKKKILYEPIEKNIYKMDEKEKREYNIKKLPSSLSEAIDELENDEILQKAIGKDAIEMFIKEKKKEMMKYASRITDLDYEFYFNC